MPRLFNAVVKIAGTKKSGAAAKAKAKPQPSKNTKPSGRETGVSGAAGGKPVKGAYRNT